MDQSEEKHKAGLFESCEEISLPPDDENLAPLVQSTYYVLNEDAQE